MCYSKPPWLAQNVITHCKNDDDQENNFGGSQISPMSLTPCYGSSSTHRAFQNEIIGWKDDENGDRESG